jgi:hypothetical protein
MCVLNSDFVWNELKPVPVKLGTAELCVKRRCYVDFDFLDRTRVRLILHFDNIVVLHLMKVKRSKSPTNTGCSVWYKNHENPREKKSHTWARLSCRWISYADHSFLHHNHY